LIVSVVVITLIVDRVNALYGRNKLPREQFMQHILGYINKDRISEALRPFATCARLRVGHTEHGRVLSTPSTSSRERER
jgi:hypothetical protein